MRKKLAVLLAGLMVFSTLAGCGQKDTQGTPANSEAISGTETVGGTENGWDGEVSHVIMTYLTLGTTPTDLEKVQTAINEKTVKEIGVEIELKPVSAFDAFSQFPTWLQTGERIDLMNPLLQDLNTYVNTGLIEPLTDLIAENAPYIQKLTDEGYTFASNNTIDGEIYSLMPIPNVTGVGGGFVIETKYLDEIGVTIDADKTYSMDDLTDIFAKIKAIHPEMYPSGVVTTGRTDSQFSYATGVCDPLGAKTYTGVLMGTDSTTIENMFESDEYYTYLKYLREWYEAGYTYPDAATTDSSNVALVASGVSCGYLMVSAPVQATADQTIIRLTELYQSSQGMGGWVIPITAEEPEAAMRFMNLMYEDVDLANLLQWGIEGEHYVVLDESRNLIGFPEGVDATTSGYYNTLGLYGDCRDIYVWDENNDQEANDAYSAEAMKNPSQGVGMIYNPSEEMTTKITALAAVAAQYIPALESGSVDLDTYYPEFIDALKKAGIEDVMEEKQEQFDAWYTAK